MTTKKLDAFPTQNHPCWVCGATQQTVVRKSTREISLSPHLFKITDSHYGQTDTLYQCQTCGFKQCHDLMQVLGFYEKLEDKDYEESRIPRTTQAQCILKTLPVHGSSKRLLDIGAGSGILVEEAQKLGYLAEGVEPSEWLCDKAIKRGLRVHLGTLPHMNLTPPYDIVTLIDVIEHVSNPVELLKLVYPMMAKDGLGVVVTPDVSSLTARLMGYRWWHYRIAHIGYFNRATLELALAKANFKPLFVTRPKWYFSIAYLIERTNQYLPNWFHLPKFKWTEHFNMPLNLFDSLLIVFTKIQK